MNVETIAKKALLTAAALVLLASGATRPAGAATISISDPKANEPKEAGITIVVAGNSTGYQGGTVRYYAEK